MAEREMDFNIFLVLPGQKESQGCCCWVYVVQKKKIFEWWICKDHVGFYYPNK